MKTLCFLLSNPTLLRLNRSFVDPANQQITVTASRRRTDQKKFSQIDKCLLEIIAR